MIITNRGDEVTCLNSGYQQARNESNSARYHLIMEGNHLPGEACSIWAPHLLKFRLESFPTNDPTKSSVTSSASTACKAHFSRSRWRVWLVRSIRSVYWNEAHRNPAMPFSKHCSTNHGPNSHLSSRNCLATRCVCKQLSCNPCEPAITEIKMQSSIRAADRVYLGSVEQVLMSTWIFN